MRHLSISFICTSLVALCLSTAALAYSGGTGEPNDPYQIADANDWQQLMNTPAHWNKSFILIADIDLNDVTLRSIGFAGSLDGKGHAIWNVTMTGPSGGNGLFWDISVSGVVQDLGICDVNIADSSSLGALCAENHGTISRCYSTGFIEDLSPIWMTDTSAGGLCGLNYGTITTSSSAAVVKGGLYIGGLCGRNDGTIVACSAGGTVSGYESVGGLCGLNLGAIKSSVAAAEVTGRQRVGGLCGFNSGGTITNSRAGGQVTGDSSSWAVGGLVGGDAHGTITRSCASGTVTGYGCVGGLCGKAMYGSIADCYSTASVVADRIVGGLCGSLDGSAARCYAAGAVTGKELVGGLVGHNDSGVATASFWDTETSGQPTSAGGIPKTTAEMKMLSTFTAWDFLGDGGGTADTWRMCTDGVDYPHLTWEYVKAGDFACPDGVAMDDLTRFADDWLLNYSAPLHGADATGDSSVTFSDFAILAAAWLD